MNEFVSFLLSIAWLIVAMAVTNAGMFFITRKFIRDLNGGKAPWSWWVLCGYPTYVWKVFGRVV